MIDLLDRKLDKLYEMYKRFEAEERKINWGTAIGLNQVDGLTPSIYLEQLVKKYMDEEININTLEKKLNEYYKKQNSNLNIIKSEKECDIVSSRIYDLISNDNFYFSIDTLKNIHKYLFKDIYDFAGVYRNCNLTKKEPIIDNDTVKYANYNEINDLLIYDFQLEYETKFLNFSLEKQVKHFAKFSSDIWQVHPFREGNTRTTAVFMIKYLRNLGYNVNNEIFKENSIFFRNALVLSNYYNNNKNIYPNYDNLYSFFEKLLSNEEIMENNKVKTKKLF